MRLHIQLCAGLMHIRVHHLESTASFRTRAISNGLRDVQVTHLVNNGFDSLSKLAFAAITPGVTRSLLDSHGPTRVTLGALSSIRRLMFEAHTLSVALVKQTIEGTEGSVKAELAPAERSSKDRGAEDEVGCHQFSRAV